MTSAFSALDDVIKGLAHKYIRRTPKPGGGYTYVYPDEKGEFQRNWRTRSPNLPLRLSPLFFVPPGLLCSPTLPSPLLGLPNSRKK